MPFVWKDAVLHKHDEASEDQQGEGRESKGHSGLDSKTCNRQNNFISLNMRHGFVDFF